MSFPRPRDLAQMSLFYFANTLFWTAMLSQLLPERIETLAGAHKGFFLALVGSGGALAGTVCVLLVGPLSDNTAHPRGRRFPWIIGGMMVGVSGVLLFALARSLPAVLLAFVLARLGLGCVVAAYEAILPERVPRALQSRASGWSEFFDLLGQVGGLMLTGLLVRGAVNAWTGAHLSRPDEAHLAVLLICGVCALALLSVTLLNLRWIAGAPWPRERTLPWSAVLCSVLAWRPSHAPDFARLYLSRCVLNLGIYTGIEFLRFYVAEAFPGQGTDLAQEVMLIGLCVTAGGVGGALAGGYLGDRWPKRTLLYGFCLLAALGATGFCLTDSLLVARVFGVVFGVGLSAINTVDWAFAVQMVPRDQEARYLALFQTCFYGPQIVALSVGSLIGQHFGYRALFWTIPLWLAVGMILLSRVREPGLVRH